MISLLKFLNWVSAGIICRKCPKCQKGFIRYSHEEQIGLTWMSVYHCDECDERYI